MCFTGKWKPLWYAIIISSAMISVGAVIGWSIEIPRLNSDPSGAFKLTPKEQDWLVGSVGLASLFTSFFAGFLIDSFGPRRLLHFFLLLATIAWIVMATSGAYGWILTSRILSGIYVQLCIIIIYPFLAEISQPGLRGGLLYLPEIGYWIGILLMNIFAHFLTWQIGTLITGILLLPVLGLYFYVHESPFWYIGKGKLTDGQRSLQNLRPTGHDNEAEVKSIKEVTVDSREGSGSFKDQILSLKEPENYRPTILLCVLLVLRQLSGALVIYMYVPFFFINAGIAISAFTSTVLVIFTTILFNLVGATIIDTVGRRNLLLSSSLVCCISMFVIGFIVQYPYTFLAWFPFVALIVFAASYGLGLGPIPWVLIAELSPVAVRFVSLSICSAVYCLLFHLQAYLLHYAVVGIGLGRLCIIFAFFNLLFALTIWLFLPETLNCTWEELQTAFAGATLRPFKKQREGYLQPYGSTYPLRTKMVS